MRKEPSVPVRKVREVWAEDRRTRAPATGAPALSVMVPLTAPVVAVWAKA
jgi:hypothetical protein